MFRYVALVWNPGDARQVGAVQCLRERLRAPLASWHETPDQAGLQVFYRNAAPGSFEVHVLPAGAGVIVGAVFERNRDPTDHSPSPRWAPVKARADAIATSRGRWLIEHCWGNYVAVGRDPNHCGAWVLKDPTGELPCSITRVDGVTVIFSSIGDLVGAGWFRFSIRPSYLAARVLVGGFAGGDALENVEQVCRGECVDVGTGAGLTDRRQFYWHPTTFVESRDGIDDSDWAARAIRATVHSCTHSWAALHDSLVHRLSGGLDSSIIAACLKSAPSKPRVCCYTYYNPRGRSDERPWARLAAKQSGHEHVESPVAPRDIRLGLVLDVPPSLEPMPVLSYVLRSTLEQTIAAERHATAVFNGDGGDSGFGAEALSYTLSDYLVRHGARGEAFRLASRIATLTQQSTWTILGRSLRRALFGAGMEQMQTMLAPASRMTSPDLHEAVAIPARHPHPWFSHLDRVPWSTILRLGMLTAPPQFYNVAASIRAPEVVAPLYSQPAIELFLRIPLHRHFEDGHERGLARRAFAGDVPAPILQRLWKDRAPGFHDELIYRNRALLRELLLDGVLVRERLLDRAAVERTFSDRTVKDPVLPAEVFRHLDVELWARRWVGGATA